MKPRARPQGMVPQGMVPQGMLPRGQDPQGQVQGLRHKPEPLAFRPAGS